MLYYIFLFLFTPCNGASSAPSAQPSISSSQVYSSINPDPFSSTITSYTSSVTATSLPNSIITEESKQAMLLMMNTLYLNSSSWLNSYFKSDSNYSTFTNVLNSIYLDFFIDGFHYSTCSELAPYLVSKLPDDVYEEWEPYFDYYYTYLTSSDLAYGHFSYPTTTPSGFFDTEVIIPSNDNNLFSSYYKYAICNALIGDINSYGFVYNQAYKTSSSQTMLENLLDDYSSVVNYNDEGLKYGLICNKMIKEYIPNFEWEPRIKQLAKTLYSNFENTAFKNTINTNDFTQTNYYTAIYQTINDNQNTTTTITTTVTSTEIISNHIQQFGDVTRIDKGTIYLNYDPNILTTAIIKAFIMDYNSEKEDYSTILFENLNKLSIVSNYSTMLSKYSGVNIYTDDNTVFNEAVEKMYSLATIIPWRSRIWDKMGWYYTENYLYPQDTNRGNTLTYTDGSGQIFAQLFDPNHFVNTKNQAALVTKALQPDIPT